MIWVHCYKRYSSRWIPTRQWTPNNDETTHDLTDDDEIAGAYRQYQCDEGNMAIIPTKNNNTGAEGPMTIIHERTAQDRST